VCGVLFSGRARTAYSSLSSRERVTVSVDGTVTVLGVTLGNDEVFPAENASLVIHEAMQRGCMCLVVTG
jgi:hypothetical protein